uniref:SHSP domain-containing protein n=1 Tax=Anolis carolinensis TaxID=28377 RepID=A0A803SXV1_ANOCA
MYSLCIALATTSAAFAKCPEEVASEAGCYIARAQTERNPKGSSSQEEESDDGGRSLCYCLDLPGFLPEEVSVKVDGRRVFATGKQDRRGKGQDGCVSHELREMRKEMLLPSDADPSGMSCCFFPDEGRLRIQTPRVTSAPLAEKRSVAIAICRVENTNTNAIPPADCKEEAPASPEKEAPAAK